MGKASIWLRALVAAMFACMVLLSLAFHPVHSPGAQITGQGLCTVSGDLPECANYEISQQNKDLEVRNNCVYTIQVYIDRGGGYCPAHDDKIAPFTSSGYHTDICPYQSVRFCE